MLFSFVGGRGHAEPLLPIAREARARGHVVAFAAQSAMVPWLEAEDFTAYAVGASTVSSMKSPLIAPDRENEARVLRDHFAGSIASGRADDLLPLLREWRPDVIVCDEVDFGALVAAEAVGVPRAAVVVLAAGSFATLTLLSDALNELRAAHGVASAGRLSTFGWDLVIAPLPPSFRDPADPLPGSTLFVRPSALESVAADVRLPVLDSERPTVYVTLGTIFNLESGDLFERVLSGLADTPWNIVVTVGPHIDPAEFGPLPENVHMKAFVPQVALLPGCHAVVCHGGSGTVVGALAHGVPLVNIPMGADQMHNAERCESLGVGLTLPVMTARPDEFRSAVTTVMSEPSYRENAALLRDESVALPSAREAVRALERLLDDRS